MLKGTMKEILDTKKERAEKQAQLDQMTRWYHSVYSVRDKTVYIEKDHRYVDIPEARRIMNNLKAEISLCNELIDLLREQMNS